MEKRISMHPHKPHATSQPSRSSHTLSAESVLSLSVCENRDGWLVAWGFCG